MALETVQRVIDERVYEFSQYNTTQSLNMMSRLAALIGEPILLAIAAGYKGDKAKSDPKGLAPDEAEAKVSDELITKSIRQLILGIGNSSEVVSVLKKLTCDGVICDNKRIEFDTHFAGGQGLAHLSKVVRAALEVQYGNFIGALIETVGGSRPRSSGAITSV